MALPSNISFGTVTGRFMRALIDGSDPDRDPDGVPLEGLIVRFTPSAKVFKNVTAALGPVTILSDPIATVTNAEGILVGPDNLPGIRLIATDDPDLNPTGWTWNVQISGSGLSISFSFILPTDGVVDLTTLVPVPSNPGTGLEDWEVVVGQAQTYAAQAQMWAEAAEAAAPTDRTIVGSFLGDSYTNLNGGTDTAPSMASRGFASWAMSLSGCQFTFRNHGIGGQTLPEMADRVDDMLAADNPAFVHLLGGLNDGYLEVPIAESIAAMDYIIDAVRSKGIPLIIGTVSGRTAWDPAKEEFASISAINRHVRTLNLADVYVADYNSRVVSPATGNLLPELSYDGTHMNTLGAYRAGLALVPALLRVAPFGEPLVNVERAEGNMLPYGRFTAGTVTGSTLPTGWSYAVNGGQTGTTVSRVPRTDGQNGSWLQLVKTEENWSTTPASGWVELADAGLQEGGWVEASIEYEYEGLNPTPALNGNPGMLVQFATAASSLVSARNYFAVTSADAQVSDDRSGVFHLTVQIPTGLNITKMRLQMPCYASGTYRFDKAMLRNASDSFTPDPGGVVVTSDTFSGADGVMNPSRPTDAALGGSPLSWSGTGQWATSGGRLTAPGGGSVLAVPFNLPDYQVSVRVVTLPSAGVYMIARSASTGIGLDNSGYRAALGFNGVRIVKNWNSLATDLTSDVAIAAGDIVTLRVVGTTISILVNGTQVLSVTDTDIASGSYAGFAKQAQASDIVLDDFILESL